MDNPDSEMVFYLMLRAVDRFYQLHSRYPGMEKFYTDFSLTWMEQDVKHLHVTWLLHKIKFFFGGFGKLHIWLFGQRQTLPPCAIDREGK